MSVRALAAPTGQPALGGSGRVRGWVARGPPGSGKLLGSRTGVNLVQAPAIRQGPRCAALTPPRACAKRRAPEHTAATTAGPRMRMAQGARPHSSPENAPPMRRYRVVPRGGAPGAAGDPRAAAGAPDGAPAWLAWLRGRWWARWLADRCADAAALGARDPQKLLERAVQLSFTANAVVQVPPGPPTLGCAELARPAGVYRLLCAAASSVCVSTVQVQGLLACQRQRHWAGERTHF